MSPHEGKRWRCASCAAVTIEAALLVAPNPFDATKKVMGCPQCFEVGDFEELCDETGCIKVAIYGFPAGPEWRGYRRTCYEHGTFAATTQPGG